MPDRLNALSPPDLDAMLPKLDALRHDLGKYVHFQARGLPAESDAERALLREALRADLLTTKRSGQESHDALTLWGELAPGVRPSLRGDEDFEALEAAMADLGAAIAALRQDRLDDDQLAAAASAAREVASRCSQLWARARRARQPGS